MKHLDPSACALILCTDPRLSRMLETELAYLGISAQVSATLTPPDGSLCLLVADGDEFAPSECAALAERCACPLMLFGRDPSAPIAVTAGLSTLRRPFPLPELEQELRHFLTDTPTPWPLSMSATARPVPEPRAPLLSVENGRVTVGGLPVSLTPAELAILEYLYAHRGEAVSRERLSSLLGGGGNSVEVYVCKLRTKLEKPLGRRMIHTVRGVGYTLDGDDA